MQIDFCNLFQKTWGRKKIAHPQIANQENRTESYLQFSTPHSDAPQHKMWGLTPNDLTTISIWHEVGVPKSNIAIIWTPVFEWYVDLTTNTNTNMRVE
jgi:hypothetical protein